MTVWIVGVDDQHTDLWLTVFDTWVAAIAAAERALFDHGGLAQNDDEYGFEPDDEWVWLKHYGTEGNCVWIRQARVQSTGH